MIQRRSLMHLIGGTISALSAPYLKHKAVPYSTPVCAPRPAIVGAWRVEAVGAPVLHHCLAFHVDGIVCSFQADGGYPNDSESDGAGEWKLVGRDQAEGAFVEFRHDRESHAYLGYVRIEFVVDVSSDGQTFTGQGHARVYDAQGNLLLQAWPTWSATRILPQATP